MFAADVPKLGQPLPRALPPDVDAAVMNAVAGLDDTFARIGPTVLRGAGLRVGELLDLEIGSIISYGPAGTWLRVPLGKLATERMVPLDTSTLAHSISGPRNEDRTGPSRTRGPGRSPTSCSPPAAAASARPGSATGCWPPPRLPGSAAPAATSWSSPAASSGTPGPPASFSTSG
ncbi:MAG TPA: hypothetical protein VHN16_14560 [Streptosporangiaceae bacterium]|nr:hypothetical protein [Streptosporangiaceae bacterium]